MRISPGNVPAEIRGNGTLVNAGPGTVYYGDDDRVTTTSNDGSLAAGASTDIDGALWLVGGPADVDVRGALPPDFGGIVGKGGARYRTVSCVLRNGGASAYFQPIDDGLHAPVNVDSVSTISTLIQMQYGSINAKRVVALIAQPDEVYAAQGFTLGCSVGLTSTDITVYRQRNFSDRIYYDGAAWQRASGSSNSPFLVGSFTAGVLRVTHATVGASNPYGVSLTSGNIAYDCVLNGTINDTTMDISFVNSARTVVTTADTNMSVYITRPQFKPEIVNPQSMATSSFPNSNIWVQGIFEV